MAQRTCLALRKFLESLVAGGPVDEVPHSLRLLAQRVAWGHDPEDVLSAWLERLVRDTRAGTLGSAAALLALDDPSLEAAIRTRLRHTSLDLAPRWKLLRQIRSHVRKALTRPPVPAPLPCGLVVGGRLSAARVRAAVDHYRSQPGSAQARLPEISTWILETWFGGDREVPESCSDQGEGATAIEQTVELAEAFAAVTRDLTAEEQELVQARLAGATIRDIASDRVWSVGATCERVRAAQDRVAGLLRRLGVAAP